MKKQITIRFDTDLLKRIERVQAADPYITMIKVIENGTRKELDELEKRFGITNEKQ